MLSDIAMDFKPHLETTRETFERIIVGKQKPGMCVCVCECARACILIGKTVRNSGALARGACYFIAVLVRF